jgi:chloramphenicol O-acetyltransferase
MDYSKWNFTATPEYTTVKEGMNKITAKYSCLPNINFTKFYSVNVTGVAANVQPIFSTPMNHDTDKLSI